MAVNEDSFPALDIKGYRIVRKIGASESAEVWLAVKDKEEYAVKIPKQELTTSMLTSLPTLIHFLRNT